MSITLLNDVDITPLDNLFIKNGLICPVPAAELLEFPTNMIQLWCVKRAVYQLPTEELINFLQEHVKDKNAIEICAGNGVIGRGLGIPRTDSHMQTLPEMILYYKALMQEPIQPPKDVLKFEAIEAISHFKPQVVIGAFVTQLYKGGNDGSVLGVDEECLLSKVEKYIHIGNDNTHINKRILSLPHTVHRFPWLVSRQMQGLNHIRIWQK